MKKLVIVFVSLIICAAVVAGCIFYIVTADTRYSKSLGEAFKAYSVADLDKCFSDDTVIICGENKDTYNNLRNNVQEAFLIKDFEVVDLYGSSEDNGMFGEKDVGIHFYGTLNGENIGMGWIRIKLKISPLFGVSAESVECDDAIFSYIFFGE